MGLKAFFTLLFHFAKGLGKLALYVEGSLYQDSFSIHFKRQAGEYSLPRSRTSSSLYTGLLIGCGKNLEIMRHF